MEEEIWAIIDGSFGKYEVSTYGKIRNAATKSVLKQTKTRKYCYVSMWYNKKKVRKIVHKLVALAFIPNENNLPQINHKDEDPTNNCVTNLEWCDASYNAKYGSRNYRMLQTRRINNCEKKEKPVVGIRGEVLFYFDSIMSAARETGVDYSNISKCCRENCYNKTAGGYIWKYANKE